MKNKSLFNKIFLSILTLVLAFFTSCEKVITLDLKNADQKVVVQGSITNIPGAYVVNLNNSLAYYSDNSFPAITGAHAKIYDDAGHFEILTETTPGTYKTASLIGTPGRKYTLEVVTNNNTYTGISVMPSPVSIDSFLITPGKSRSGNSVNGYRVVCKFTDPIGIGDFYRVIINSNDSLAIGDNNSRIVSDKLSDGQQLSVSFRTKLIVGDSLFIQLQCIDKRTYDFYNTLGGAIGNAGLRQFLSALPANPISNINNGGLGYFSAYSVSKMSESVH
jgi:Domain of unknown function (DUF4249)